jgi:hypothetical protein
MHRIDAHLAALQAAVFELLPDTGLKPCALRGRAFSPEDATNESILE